MSLLEHPIRATGDRGNGKEPMLLIGTEVIDHERDGLKHRKVIYLCVDGAGEVWELTSEWLNVHFRWNGNDWDDLEFLARAPEPE